MNKIPIPSNPIKAIVINIHTIGATQHLMNSINKIDEIMAAPKDPRSIGHPIYSSKIQLLRIPELIKSLTEYSSIPKSGKQ